MQPSRSPDGDIYNYNKYPQYYRKPKTIHQIHQQLPQEESVTGNYYGDEELDYYYAQPEEEIDYGYEKAVPQESGEIYGRGYDYAQPFKEEVLRSAAGGRYAQKANLKVYAQRKNYGQENVEGYLPGKTQDNLDIEEYLYSKSKQELAYLHETDQEHLEEYLHAQPEENLEYPQRKPKTTYYRRKTVLPEDVDTYLLNEERSALAIEQSFKRQQSPALAQQRVAVEKSYKNPPNPVIDQPLDTTNKTRKYYYRTPDGYVYKKPGGDITETKSQIYKYGDAQTEMLYNESFTTEDSTRPYYVVPVLYVPKRSEEKTPKKVLVDRYEGDINQAKQLEEYQRYMDYYYNKQALEEEGETGKHEEVLGSGLYDDGKKDAYSREASPARDVLNAGYITKRRNASVDRPSTVDPAYTRRRNASLDRNAQYPRRISTSPDGTKIVESEYPSRRSASPERSYTLKTKGRFVTPNDANILNNEYAVEGSMVQEVRRNKIASDLIKQAAAQDGYNNSEDEYTKPNLTDQKGCTTFSEEWLRKRSTAKRENPRRIAAKEALEEALKQEDNAMRKTDNENYARGSEEENYTHKKTNLVEGNYTRRKEAVSVEEDYTSEATTIEEYTRRKNVELRRMQAEFTANKFSKNAPPNVIMEDEPSTCYNLDNTNFRDDIITRSKNLQSRSALRPKSTLNRIEEDKQSEEKHRNEELRKEEIVVFNRNDEKLRKFEEEPLSERYNVSTKAILVEKGVQAVEDRKLMCVSTQTECEQPRERRSMIPSCRHKVTMENCYSDEDPKEEKDEQRSSSAKLKKPSTFEQLQTRVPSPVRRSRKY